LRVTLELILIGLVITLEPLPLTAFILLLASRRGVKKGAAFVFGWIASLAIVIAITVLVTGNGVRYARAFNTLGGENMADPNFADGPADMFFCAAEDDRDTVEIVIEGVGLRPVYVGADQEAIVDCLFRLWIALAVAQGRGRRLAQRLLEG
jgi:hypothetical protein